MVRRCTGLPQLGARETRVLVGHGRWIGGRAHVDLGPQAQPGGVPVLVEYDEDGTPLGHFVTDLLIEQQLVVELKACLTIVPEHTAQILGYLRGSRLRHGLLINFGAPQLQIKKLIW